MEHDVSKTEVQDLSAKAAALKQHFADIARLGKERAVTGTKEYARAHPAIAMGIVAGVAAGIGLAIGLLAGRRSN
jgi:ElaB/YqjD/DUF883 family membrane-anchored ribosome-binding protein